MQALENIGVLEKDEEKGGRRVTHAGQRDLDRESTPSCDIQKSSGYSLTDLVDVTQVSPRRHLRSRMKRKRSRAQ